MTAFGTGGQQQVSLELCFFPSMVTGFFIALGSSGGPEMLPKGDAHMKPALNDVNIRGMNHQTKCHWGR